MYTMCGMKAGRTVERSFPTLQDAKKAGEHLWRGMIADHVEIRGPRGAGFRLVKDERPSRHKRMTWRRLQNPS